AEFLKEKKIEGAFTHLESREEVPSMARIAYFTGNPMYLVKPPVPSWEEILEAMEREKIRYFYYFGEDLPWEWRDDQGGIYPELTGGEIPGFRVWRMEPREGK